MEEKKEQETLLFTPEPHTRCGAAGERDSGEINCYCMNLRRASNLLTQYYDRAMMPAGVTANQYFLLHVIGFLKECNKSELARHTRLERTTVIRNLEILLKKRLIEQAPGPTRRNGLIRLTDHGRETEEKGTDLWKRAQREMEALLGREKLAVLQELPAELEQMTRHE